MAGGGTRRRRREVTATAVKMNIADEPGEDDDKTYRRLKRAEAEKKEAK